MDLSQLLTLALILKVKLDHILSQDHTHSQLILNLVLGRSQDLSLEAVLTLKVTQAPLTLVMQILL